MWIDLTVDVSPPAVSSSAADRRRAGVEPEQCSARERQGEETHAARVWLLICTQVTCLAPDLPPSSSSSSSSLLHQLLKFSWEKSYSPLQQYANHVNATARRLVALFGSCCTSNSIPLLKEVERAVPVACRLV